MRHAFEDHALIATVDFDYDAIDGHLDGQDDDEILEDRRRGCSSGRAEFLTAALLFAKESAVCRIGLDAVLAILGVGTPEEETAFHRQAGEGLRLEMRRFQKTVGLDSAMSLAEEDRQFMLRLLRYVKYSSRARVTLDCLFIAMNGEQLSGITMAEVGRQHGLTTAMISKHVQLVQRDLRLPACRYNKSEQARQNYARYNKRPFTLPD